MKRAFLVQWAGRNGRNRTDTVYSSSLRTHWATVAKRDLSPKTKYYISVQPFLYKESIADRIVDMLEPILSPTESLTGKHYERLQRMAWQAQQNISLDVTPPVDVHNPIDFASWHKQIQTISSPQHANDFAVALLDYYKQRESANNVMTAAWHGEERKDELEQHVTSLREAIDKLDTTFRNAFPAVRCIDDLPKTQTAVLM